MIDVNQDKMNARVKSCKIIVQDYHDKKTLRDSIKFALHANCESDVGVHKQ